MNPRYLIILTMLLVMTLSCTDSVGPSRRVGESMQSPSASLNNNAVSDSLGLPTILQLCCNNLWPGAADDPTHTARLDWCEGDPFEEITNRDCAEIWAKYNPTRGVRLRFQACGGDPPGLVTPVASLDGSVVNNHPKLDWSFIYSHYYVIKRKIGSGSWVIIMEQDNCTNDINCGDTWYIDNTININTLTNNVYYRVYAKIYGRESSTAPEVVYYPPELTVNITGPTQLTTMESGEFTANVSGGYPPYSYSWHKYQECDDPWLLADGQPEPLAPPCGYWRRLPDTSQTIYKGGNIPGFRLKVVVTDQNNDTDIDYHYVTVVLP